MPPEKLQTIKPYPYWLKPLPEDRKPKYTECEKQIMAWSITWEGTIRIEQIKNKYCLLRITIGNTEPETSTAFLKIARLGTIPPKETQQKTKWKPMKRWSISNHYDALFFLQNIIHYITSERKKQIACLVIRFCKSRIFKHQKYTHHTLR